MPQFEHPAWLFALPLALLPWLWHGQVRIGWASLASLPPDGLSRFIAIALRALASLVIVSAALSLAGAYRQGKPVERVGTGAHVMILLDRSASMADGFAGTSRAASAGQAPPESKGHAAARLLSQLVRERQRDLFGMILFSTAPMYVLGLTEDHDAILAAIDATSATGIGLTHISAGLAMALEQFRDRPVTGSRVVLLVSDGAASIDPRSQITLRRLAQEFQVQLYWIYLRAPSGASPTRPPDPEKSGDVAPEYFLDQFFRDLGTPYRLYEADNPQSLEVAINDVSELQNLPLRYFEPQPRQDLSRWFDVLALLGTLILLSARWLEQPRWQVAGRTAAKTTTKAATSAAANTAARTGTGPGTRPPGRNGDKADGRAMARDDDRTRGKLATAREERAG